MIKEEGWTWKDELEKLEAFRVKKERHGFYTDLARHLGCTRQQAHYMMTKQENISFVDYRKILDFCGKVLVVDGVPLDPLEGGADVSNRLMKKYGVKQNELAEAKGVSPQTICKMLKKGNLFKASTVYGIAKFCGAEITIADK